MKPKIDQAKDQQKPKSNDFKPLENFVITLASQWVRWHLDGISLEE